MKYFDQHVHSSYSHDSKAKLEDYILLALSNGQENFVTTDHCDIYTPDSPFSYLSNFEKEKQQFKDLQIKYPSIHLMQGIEIGYNKSATQRQIEIIKNINASIINLSIHYYHYTDFYVCNYSSKEEIDRLMKIYLNQAKEACETFPDFDTFCHIDYGYKNAFLQNPNINFSEYDKELREFLITLIKRDKILEINTKVQEKICDNFTHLKYLLELYKSLGGVNISLSSDAHKIEEYNRAFDKYLPFIKDAGFDHLNCIVERKRYNIYI